MVSTGASLDKSMAYQKLIVTVVTRHVKDTPCHFEESDRLQDFSNFACHSFQVLKCLLSPRKV